MSVKITIDRNVDVKRVRKLESCGFIEVYRPRLEKPSKKTPNIMATRMVLGYTHLPAKLCSDDTYSEIRSILGKAHVNDAIMLDTHIRSGNDYFVTEDKDEFISNGRREKLQGTFLNLKIVTLAELEIILDAKIN